MKKTIALLLALVCFLPDGAFAGSSPVIWGPSGIATMLNSSYLVTNGGVVFNGNASPQTALNYYAVSSKSAAWSPQGGTGGANSASVTVRYARSGDWVTMFIPNFTLTATSACVHLRFETALDTWVRPATNIAAMPVVGVRTNAGDTAVVAKAVVETDGTVRIYKDSTETATFTSGASAGLNRSISLTWYVGTGS